jgi:hypothetical protein
LDDTCDRDGLYAWHHSRGRQRRPFWQQAEA